MKRSNPANTVAADAIECFRCLADPDADPRVRAKWVAWLGASADNRAAYEAVQRTWRRPLPTGLWPSEAELAADDYDPEISVAEHRIRKGEFAASRVSPGLVLAALVLVMAVGAFALRDRWPSGPAVALARYDTGRGETRTVALGDGSTVLLGPLSEFEVTGAGGRGGRLLAGEALFDVIHNSDRPFAVSAGIGEVRDLGTRFSVALDREGVTVTVVEGSVSVADRPPGGKEDLRTLSPGQQVTYTDAMGAVRTVDAAIVTGWSRGRLAYVDRPLGEVAADLTRYSKVDVVIADPAVAALRYTGTIDTDAVGQWAVALAKVYPVQVEGSAGRLALRSAPKT